MAGMLPSRQQFNAGQLITVQVNLWLIKSHELVSFYGGNNLVYRKCGRRQFVRGEHIGTLKNTFSAWAVSGSNLKIPPAGMHG